MNFDHFLENVLHLLDMIAMYFLLLSSPVKELWNLQTEISLHLMLYNREGIYR